MSDAEIAARLIEALNEAAGEGAALVSVWTRKSAARADASGVLGSSNANSPRPEAP